ncbi:MAG: hypothetical protein ABW252_24545 [Polyangiales bacterium]
MNELARAHHGAANARASRFSAWLRGVCCAAALLASVRGAQAQDARDVRAGAAQHEQDEDGSPRDASSIGAGAARGLVAGALAGLGGSYLVVRPNGVARDRGEWRALGLGVGVGALTGAGLGIALGAADRSGAPGGRYVARDLVYGTAFGTLAGGLAGGITAIAKGDAERPLHWASIGALAGAGVGLLAGVIEGQAKRDRNTRHDGHARVRLTPSVNVAATPRGAPAGLAPGVRGSF